MRRLLPFVLLMTAGAVLVPAAAQAAPGRVIVTGYVSHAIYDPDRTEWVDLTCPAGHVLGGGGTITYGGPVGGVLLTQILVSPGGLVLTVGSTLVYYDAAATWSMTAWAVCGTVSGYEVVTAQAATDAGATSASAVAVCPAGKKVIGSGAATAFPYVLDSIDVASDLGNVRLDVFQLASTTSTYPHETPLARVQAICVTPMLNQARVTASSASSSQTELSAGATCPSPTVPYGVSGGITGATGRAIVRSLALAGTAGSIASRWVSAPGPAWYTYVHVVCAPG
jgi:hypothetical protein